jgi:hypothetical protein
LAFVNKKNLLSKGQARIFMVPGEVSEEDVEQAISGRSKTAPIKDYLRALEERSRQKESPATLSPLEYEIILEESSGSSAGLIRLRVVKGYDFDPVYSALEIGIEAKGKSASGQISWKANTWRIE